MNEKKPKDFLEAIKLLEAKLSQKQKDEMLEYNESEVGPSLYFSLGLWIMNNWITDVSSPLGQYILSKKPIDLDEYVHLIIKIYHRYLNGKPLKIDYEVKKLEEKTI
jgi:hypothetical protein